MTSNDGKMLESDGRLIYIDGNDESNFIASASMVEVNGQSASYGRWDLLKLTQTETLSLTTGKVLDIHTKSSDAYEWCIRT